MQQLLITRTLQLIGGIALWCWVPITVVKAQIAPDGTLSTNVNTSDGLNFTINNGNRAGNNLFHSFREFSVPAGGSAFFNNAFDVQNIFSRVTGGNISNINGLIRANGTANLFLINPSGIIFGSGARLNIGGSFLASTANSLVFDGGSEFSATNLQATPLLSVNIPIGLRFRESPGSIINQSTVQVQPGKSLMLVGGDVNLDSGILLAPGGRVELGGLAEAGTVALNVDGNNLSLSFPDGVARANVMLTTKAEVNVRAGGGGSITINAQNLELTQGSTVKAGIASKAGSVDSKAGDIEINAQGAITISDPGSFISNSVLENATGKGGDIRITGRSLSVTNGGQLAASTLGQGDGGSIDINVQGLTLFDGTDGTSDGRISAAYSRVESSATGQGGTITITTASLSVTNGARLDASTNGKGNAGSVNINVRDTAYFQGEGPATNFRPSAAYSRAETKAEGNGGRVNIEARNLTVSDGAVISASSDGRGIPGIVNINVSDTAIFNGVGSFNGKFQQSSGAFSSVKENNSELGENSSELRGSVNLTTGTLYITNGASLFTSTLGKGNAGNVTINIRDTAFLDGVGPDFFPSGVYSRVETGAIGQGGNVNITARALRLTNGAVLTTSTDGKGKAGNVIVNTRDIVLDGEGNFNPKTGFRQSSGAFSSVKDNGIGEGGNIHITAESLRVTNGAALVTSTLGQGNAGNVRINIRNTASFDGLGVNLFPSGAYSRVETSKAVDRGGNINITADTLSLTNGAVIGVNSKGQGNAGEIGIQADLVILNREALLSAETATTEGGNINLQTGSLQLRHGSRISTTAGTARAGGNGGNITIGTQTLVGLENSDITANAFQGQGGRIKINAEGVFGLKARTLEELQTQLGIDDFTEFDSSQLLSSDITAISQQGGPQFQGSVQVITPDVDPSSGLIELPQTVVDPDALIAQNPCTLGKGSEFTVTGRGGLPPNPSEALSSRTVRVSLIEPTQPSTTGPNTAMTVRAPRPDSLPIVPAQGWILNEKGQLVFTAYNPTGTGSNRLGRNTPTCPAR